MVKSLRVSKYNKKRTLKRGGKRSLSKKKTQKRKSSKRSVRNTKGKNLRGMGRSCDPTKCDRANKKGECTSQCASNECCFNFYPPAYCTPNCP